jgi:hypothetical protein
MGILSLATELLDRILGPLVDLRPQYLGESRAFLTLRFVCSKVSHGRCTLKVELKFDHRPH